MLEIIYNDAKDEHVANFIAYGAPVENVNKLFYDEAHTRQVTYEDALDAFKKGRLLVDVYEAGLFAAINVVEDSVLVAIMAGEAGSKAIRGITFAVATE